MSDEANETAETEVPEAPVFDAAAHSEQLAVEAGTLIKCKPWGKGQGDYVLVDAGAFDPDFHIALDPLDHDSDGRKGGSLSDAVEEAQAELAPASKSGSRKKAAAKDKEPSR